MTESIGIEIREEIFDWVIENKILWNGNLSETNFLSRIFDLKKIQSTDIRFDTAFEDIRRHREDYQDWEYYWIFDDARFNLRHCENEIFLKFLCKMLDPKIRDIEQSKNIANELNKFLHNCKIKLVNSGSDNAPYKSKKLNEVEENSVIVKFNDDIVNFLSADYVKQKIDKISEFLDFDSSEVIGSAKELLETVFKEILKRKKIEFSEVEKFSNLYKKVAKELGLDSKAVDENKKGYDLIFKTLSNISSIINSINQLRNSDGTGHGRDVNYKSLPLRHGKLVAGLTSSIVLFLLETYNEKNP